MYKAVFIDLDGTLLKSDHTVSDANRKAIQQLLQQGIKVIIVSARPLHGILPISETVVTSDMPVVSLNGSYILDSNQIVYQVAVPLKDTINIHKEVLRYDVTCMYYTQMEWFAAKDTDLVKKEQRITPVKIIIQPFEETLAYWSANNSGANKILIAGNENEILTAEQRLLSLYAGQLNIYKSQPRYLEVMNIEASKTKAIQFLLKKYGLDKSAAMAIGDNYNDKEMLQFAGTGVAMGNAPADIQQIAGYVTDTNNNDGVAKALQHFFNLPA